MSNKKKSQSKPEFLTTNDLAKRWGVHRVTLDRWRMNRTGPPFIKLGGDKFSKVVYKISDVEKYEQENVIKTKG